jgi:hypothetical protein
VLGSRCNQVTPTDTAVFTSTALCVAAFALLGEIVPAIRAARVDPVAAVHEVDRRRLKSSLYGAFAPLGHT